MPYVFKSRACADLLMLDGPARQILETIGKEAATKGIITVEAMPAAIKALEDVIARDKGQIDDKNEEDAQEQEAEVSLAQRAWPFVQMLKSAYEANEPVVWGV